MHFTLCCEQTCEFSVQDWTKIQSKIGLFACKIRDAKCDDESLEVVTNTASNLRTNADVQMVYFDTRNMKFLPNDIYDIFPNVEFLYVYKSNLNEFKPNYLKNAVELTKLQFHYSNVKELGPKVFAEAPKLQSLELQYNKIETIDILAFHGLPDLSTIYLFKNKIKKLQPTTFSHLTKLTYIGFDDGCVNKIFHINRNGFKDIEQNIRKNCDVGRSTNNANGNVNSIFQSGNPFASLQSLISQNARKINDLESSLEVCRNNSEFEIEEMKADMDFKMKELTESITKITEAAFEFVEEKIKNIVEKLEGKVNSIKFEEDIAAVKADINNIREKITVVE